MKILSYLKYALYAFLAFYLLRSCFDTADSSENVQYEEVVLPTQGLITVVKEVQKDQFKIEEEVTIPDTSGSLIIANYLDSTADTFTLAEARLMEANGYPGRSGSIMQAASYGLFGYMMYRGLSGSGMMGSRRPQQGAYTSKQAYDKTSKNAGKSLNNTASRVRTARPSSGRSGFGGGSRSTRSVGG